MAIIKSIVNTFVSLLLLSKLTACLYEDQIGVFDWKKSHIGKLKYASFDSVKRLVVASEENVVAALGLKSGQIAWRQLLESPETHSIELLHVSGHGEVFSVSGDRNAFNIRGWDVNTGVLLYEWSLLTERTGSRWLVAQDDQLIHVVPVVGSHLEITGYQIKTGVSKQTTTRLSTPWVKDLNLCAIADTYWTCLSEESSSGQIYYIDLAGDLSKVHTQQVSQLIGDAPGKVVIKPFKHSEPAILLERNRVNRLVLIKETASVLPYSLQSNVISVTGGDQTILIQIEYVPSNTEKPIQVKTFNLQTDEQNVIQLEPPYNDAGPNLITGICRGSNCRIVFTAFDDSVSLLQLPSGSVLWSREEALSQIVASEFVELPLSELEASIEQEFNEASGDVISMFVSRLVNQAKQLKTLITGQPASSNNILVRDNFGLHKLIIVATKAGKLFAIDTVTGDIVWSKYLHTVEPFDVLGKKTMLLFLQRTSRYSSAQMMLIAKNGPSVATFKFNPITGQALSGIHTLGHGMKQAFLLPYEDKNHMKGIVILTDNNELVVIPESAKALLHENRDCTFLFNVDTANSTLDGYTFNYSMEKKPVATPTWKVNFGGAKIVAVSMRPSNERVHSQGRVLADRSVFYKYVNPNLIAVATVGDDVMHKHILSVYLVDGVTGLVVHSAHHKRANGPVHMVHSENWIVYSYFSERFRRHEITSVELYEGAMQSNSTAFSSHALSQLPHPESLSYIFPITPLTMAATLTERGITNKHILVALSSGGVVQLPWALLEPRGAHLQPNPEEVFIPYMPELPIITENIINYNQSLARITSIRVSPAKLESTSLVIAYGLDMFYTRVTPSKTFDVLKEDFDHVLIVIVLVALTAASYITKHLSIRKALKQQWK